MTTDRVLTAVLALVGAAATIALIALTWAILIHIGGCT